MTAEVAVLSRVGVALAADSAVTVDSATGKVYASADKLFQLSLVAPVAVMVYGNADVLGVPWETVLKIFRRRLGHGTFDRLDGYASALLADLGAKGELFTGPMQQRFVRNVALEILDSIREPLEARIEQELRKKGPGLSEEEIKNIIAELVQSFLDVVSGEAPLDDLPPEFLDVFLRQHGQDVERAIQDAAPAFPMDDDTRGVLTRLVGMSLCRRRPKPWDARHPFMSGDSGIVIAGFGERDHFPVMVELGIRGLAADTLLFERRQKGCVGGNDGESDALIFPFAQTEALLPAGVESATPGELS